MAANLIGNVFLLGQNSGTIDFGGGPLSTLGDQDVIVAKLAP